MGGQAESKLGSLTSECISQARRPPIPVRSSPRFRTKLRKCLDRHAPFHPPHSSKSIVIVPMFTAYPQYHGLEARVCPVQSSPLPSIGPQEASAGRSKRPKNVWNPSVERDEFPSGFNGVARVVASLLAMTPFSSAAVPAVRSAKPVHPQQPARPNLPASRVHRPPIRAATGRR